MRRVLPVLLVGSVTLLGQTRSAPPPPRPARDNPIVRSQPALRASATGRIRGRVLAGDGPSARPLAKARVTVAGPTDVAPIFTDASGRFDLPGLKPGTYILTAAKTGYVRTRYGSRRTLDPAIEIDVESGTTVDGVDIILPKGAAIFGRITDPGGDPVVGGEVSVSAVQAVGGELRLVSVPQPVVETNDLGEYRVGDLSAGRYFLVVDGAGLGTMPSGMPREWERLTAWGRTFFPGVAALTGAVPITLGIGEEHGGTDFVVVAGAARAQELVVNITGVSPAPSGAAPSRSAFGANIEALGGRGVGGFGQPTSPNTVTFISADTSVGATVQRNQVMSFGSANSTMKIGARLDPGDWIAVARQGRNGAIFPFTISSGDTDIPINLVLGPGAHVSGRVVFDGTRLKPSAAGVQVDVHGAGPDQAIPPRLLTRSPVTPNADGTFDIADVFGTIALDAAPPPGWTLKAVTYGDRDLLDTPLTLKSGESVAGVQVVLTDEVATLVGSAVDVDGRLVSGCAIALFPDARSFQFNPRRMRLQRSNQQGQFTLADLPSGSYLAAAEPDIDASVWLTSDGLDRLRVRALPLTLADRERKTITLPCLP